MRVLIVGSGGREHAIAWKIAQSPLLSELLCAPGNPGIGELARLIPANAEDVGQIVEICKKEKPDLVVIGPEVPLAKGMTDEIKKLDIAVFGPDKKCARLEASKQFTKEFLSRHSIPTAQFKSFTDMNETLDNIGVFGWPMVIKADGLAAGKGVVLAGNEAEAKNAIEEMMSQHKFGDAGERVVIEECLLGVEASVLCFVDSSAIVPMVSAQDYKRIFDNDLGPNTGGMGTYSPNLVFTPELEQQIRSDILEPTFQGFKDDGLNFHGVLFIGLMITDEGPKVIEFNNRFGDPEAQSVLRRLDSDLLEILIAVTEDRLDEQEIIWSKDASVTVVIASGGYPADYKKGIPITGLDKMDDGIVVFHAGTKTGDGGELLTSGGRVLGISAVGQTHDEAREKAYDNVRKIAFEGAQYRKDIGIVYK